MKVYESNLYEVSIEGFVDVLKNLMKFDDKKPTISYVTGQNQFRELFKRTGEINYPFFVYTINRLSEDNQRYNNFALRKSGFRADKNIDDNFSYNYKLKAVNVTLTIRFITNNNKHVHEFAKRWLLISKAIKFDIVERNGSFSVQIGVDIPDEVEFPEQEFEDIGDIFQAETTADIKTFIGDVHKIPLINKAKINSNITDKTNPSNLEDFIISSITIDGKNYEIEVED